MPIRSRRSLQKSGILEILWGERLLLSWYLGQRGGWLAGGSKQSRQCICVNKDGVEMGKVLGMRWYALTY
jgi:hypothetical protein